MSNFLEEFGKRNFQTTNPNQQESSDARIPLTGPVTNPNISFDPSLIQRSFQTTSTNMWHELLNSWDEINKGEPNQKLIKIQSEIDDLDADPSIPEEEKTKRRNALIYAKTASLEELNNIQKDIDSRAVDLDYTATKNAKLAEEDTDPFSAFVYETPNELGGTMSGMKYQIGSMLATAASAGLSSAAIGGHFGAVLGFVGSVGSSIYFNMKGREQETASEVSEAYDQKVNMLTQNYMIKNNGKAPDEVAQREIRQQAYKGLDELAAKNNMLVAGDIAQTAMSLVPWFKWGGLMTKLAGSRALATGIKLGMSSGINAIGEGVEEGEQFLYKKDYMNDNFMGSTGRLDYIKNYLESKGDVVPAVFGEGRYDLYGDKDFRQAVKSGFSTGLLFDAGNTTLSKMYEHYQYNKVKTEMSKEAMSAAEDSFTKYKGETIYSMFSRGKEDSMHRAIETFGKKGLLGYTKESAATEIESLKKLKEQFDSLNDAIKTPTGALYKAYVNGKKGTDVALAAERLKREAFTNFIAIENLSNKITDLYEKNNTAENTDDYGYIGSDKQSISDEVNKQADKLGLDPSLLSKVKQNRVDTVISALENKLATLKERTKSIMTGEAIAGEEEKIAESKDILRTKDPKLMAKKLAAWDFKYRNGEESEIARYKQRDSLFEPLTTADNIKIVKDLDGKREIGDLLEEVTSAGIPLDSRVAARLKQASEPLAQKIADYEAMINEGPKSMSEEDVAAYDKMYAEYSAFPDLEDLLNKVDDLSQPLQKELKSDDAYRREYHDGFLKDVAAIEDLIKSPENEPIDQASALQGVLEVLSEVYNTRTELHSKEEFKGFKEELAAALAKIQEIVKEIERRQKDRDAKNTKVVNERASVVYSVMGILRNAEGEFMLGSVSPWIKFLGVSEKDINEAVKALNEDFKATGIISSVFYEGLIAKLKANKELKESSIETLKEVIFVNSEAVSKIPGVSKLAGRNYITNPEKGFKDVFRSLTKGKEAIYFQAIKEYNRTRSIAAVIDVLKKDPSLTIMPEVNSLLALHSSVTGYISIYESLQTNYDYATQVADEKAMTEAKNFKNAPSIQQRQAVHAVLKWLGVPIIQKEMYEGFSYLSGFAGTGKTFVAGLIRKFLPYKDNEIYAVAHSTSAHQTLATSLELDVSKSKYKTDKESPLDHLIDLLSAKSALLKETKIIFMDEAGFVSSERMNVFARLLMDYNADRQEGEKIRVVAFGDAYQISEDGGINTVIDANNGSQINMKIFKPLSVSYRTGVADITNIANKFLDNTSKVTSLHTRTNKLRTEGVTATNVESELVRELQTKEKEGLLNDSRTRLVIVHDEGAVKRLQAVLTHPSIKVVSYINAQGLTADEAYISLHAVNELEVPEVFNKAMYTAITRARHYVAIADRNLTTLVKPKVIDTFNNVEAENAEQIKVQKEQYVKTVASEYDYLKSTGEVLESNLGEVEKEPLDENDIDEPTTEETTVPEEADTEEVDTDDLLNGGKPNVIDDKPIPVGVPGEHSLMYPQNYIKDRTTGLAPIAVGDEVIYVKSVDRKGNVHIRVVKSIDGRNFTLVGIVGTEAKDFLTELEQLKDTNPELHSTIISALGDTTQPTLFNSDASLKYSLTLGLNESLNVIAKAKIKEYRPAGVKFSDDLSNIDEALKERIREDVRKTLLKNNQSATKVDIQGVIYTLQGAKTGIGTPMEEIPESQPFVKPGIPYIRVKVHLSTGGVNVFHINTKFSKLDPERHAEFLSPLTNFLDSVSELEDLYAEAGFGNIFQYNSPVESELTKVNVEGEKIFITKGELFRKSIQWYHGSGGIDEHGQSEGIAYLANPKNINERLIEESLRAKLTPEQLERLYELRSTIHNLIGITKFESDLKLSGLSEMDRIPEEIAEAPLNKSTNTKIVGKVDDFTVFEGSDGLVGVKYYKYLGYWFKIKVKATKIGNEYKLTGAAKCRIQTSLEATSDDNFSVRNDISIGKYEEEMFSTAGAVQASLDAFAAQAKHKVGLSKDTGSAQRLMGVLAKVNTEITAPDGSKIKVRFTPTIEEGGKGQGRRHYGIKLMPDSYDENTPTLGTLSTIHNNETGELNFPIKALKEEDRNENGDAFDTSLVQTDYNGFTPSATVLHEISIPGKETTTPQPSTEPSKDDKVKAKLEALKRFGSKRKGKTLSKTVDSSLGAEISLEEAYILIKKYIPNITPDKVRFVTEAQMLRLTYGEAAWGYFKDGVVYLETNNGKVWANAVRHEVFHKVFWNSFDSSERLHYYKLALKNNPSLRGKSTYEVEEWLAENFQIWKNTGKTEYVGLKGLFKRIADFISFVFSSSKKLDRLFSDIEAGKFSTRYEVSNVSRPLTKINERFGSIENYKEAKAIYLNYINGLTNMYKDFQGRLLTINEEDKQNYPLTLEEAKNEFIEMATVAVEAFEAGETEYIDVEEIPYFKLLLKGTNIDDLTNDFYRFSQDFSTKELENDLKEFFEGTSFEGDANLKQEIEAAEFINLETKVTNNVKNVLNSIYYGPEGSRVHLKWTFCYLKMLQLMQFVNFHDSTRFREQLNAAFKFQNTQNPSIKALHTEINDLFDLSEINNYNNAKGERKKLPAGEFTDGNTFVSESGKTIIRGNKEHTVDFFNRINKSAGINDVNAINIMFRKQRATNTINEFISHFASQRERNPIGGVVKTYASEIEGDNSEDVKYLYNIPNNANIEQAIETDIAAFLVSKLNKNRAAVVNFAKLFDKGVKAAKTNADNIALVKTFFKMLGNSIKTKDMITDPKPITDALRDIKELLDGVISSNNLDEFIEGSSGRTRSLASLVAYHSPEARAANYIDPKNRRMYRWVSQSGSYSLLSRIVKFFKPEFKGIQTLPDFLTNTQFGENRFAKHNIFINGLNKMSTIVDPQYMVYSKENKVVDYKDENKQDALSRRFNVQFLGYMLNNKKASKPKYIQQVYTISNKPVVMGVTVDTLNEAKLKESIKQALLFELSRKEYQENLIAAGINVKNIDKSVNHIYFNAIGKITETKRAEWTKNIDAQVNTVYNSLIEKAKAAYVEYKKEVTKEDLRLLSSESSQEFASKIALFKNEDDFVEGVYASYYLNNYVNGYFLSHLYFGDRAFAKLNKWDDVIKRLQSSFGIGKTPAIGPKGAMPSFRVVVAQDDKLLINKNTDYTDKLKKLYNNKGYDSTDAQMYVLPSFVASIRAGLGNSTATKDILKPVYFGIDKFGVPRLIKTSAIELTDELCADFPELKAIRDQLIEAKSHAYVFESAMKIGAPNELSERGMPVNANSIVELNTADLRIQLNPLAKLDSEVASFSQLLYLLNVNRLNTEETKDVYETNAKLIDRNLSRMLKRVTDREGNFKEHKLRSIVLDSFMDSDGRVLAGSERLHELLSLPISAEDREPFEGEVKAELLKLSLSMPSLVKKVITQLSSSFSGVVALKFRGTKAVLTSASPIKLYQNESGIVTYSNLNQVDKERADKFYTKYSPKEQSLLIRAKEAKDFNSLDKFKEELKGIENLSPSFMGDINAFMSSSEHSTIFNVTIPRRLRMMSSTEGDVHKNYAEAVVPYDMAKSIADKLGIDINELKNTMIGVRIPSTGIHSSIPIKIIGFLNTRSNIISVPEEVVPLHGSDFDVDSLFVIKREELSEKETNDTVKIKNAYLTKKEQVFFNSLYESSVKRKKEKYGPEGFNEVQAKKEFANSVGIWYSEATNNFEKYAKEKSSKLGLDTIKVLNSAPRNLTPEETARFEETFKQESEEVKARVAASEKSYVEEIHRADFAKKNRLVSDPNTGMFTYGSVRIATHGDFIGYAGNSLDPDYIAYLDLEIENAKNFKSDKPEEMQRVQKIPGILERLKDKYYNNRVMDGYLKIVTAEKNRDDMFTPISMDIFKKDLFPMLSNLTGKEDLLGDLDPNDEIDQVNIQQINMSGAQEVSKIANTMKGLSYLSYVADLNGLEATIRYPEGQTPFEIDGVPITKLSDSQLPMNSKNTYNSWEVLDSLINAAIDNVKEQILGIINLNGNTGNVYCTLIGCGVPMEHAVLMMQQPVIKEILFYSDKYKAGKKLAELEAKLKEYANNEVGEQAINISTYLTRDNLAKGAKLNTLDDVYENLESVNTQLAVIKMFTFFNKIGEDVFRATSGINLTRSLPIDIAGVRESVANLESTGSDTFAFANTDITKIPHISKAKEVAVVFDNMIKATIVGQNDTTTALVKELIANMGIRLDRMNAVKNIELVKEELIKYLLNTYKDFLEDPSFSFTKNDKTLYGNEAWVQSFLDKVLDIKTNPEYQDNAFLQYVSTENISSTTKWLKLVFTAGTALSDDEKLDVANDFLKLSVAEQKDFLKYAVLIQGMSFGVSSYSTYMNPVLQAGLSVYLEKPIQDLLVTKESFDKVVEHFGVQLALKNVDKVPTLDYNNIEENSAKVETWTIKYTTEKGLPLYGRTGRKNKETILALVKSETTGTLEQPIYVGYYTKIAEPRGSNYNTFASQIYHTSLDVLENGWSIKERFDVNLKVLDAPKGTDINNIESLEYSTTGKRFTVKEGKKERNYYPSKYPLEVGMVVAFKDVRDELRSNLVHYRVKSVVAVTDNIQKVTYEKVETPKPSMFEGNSGVLNTYSRIQKATAVETFSKIKDLNGLIAYLSNNSVNPETKLILKSIVKYKLEIGNIPVKLDSSLHKGKWLGVFQSGDNAYLGFNPDVLLDTSKGLDKTLSSIEHIVSHELVHVLLRHVLEHKDNYSLKGDVLKSINRLELVFQNFRKIAKEQNIQARGFVNVDEFIAEFMANPKFRSLTASMLEESKSDTPKTLYTIISEILKKILDFVLSRTTETEDLINGIHNEITSLIDISQPSSGKVDDIYGMDSKFSFYKDNSKDAEFNAKVEYLTDNLEVSEDEKEYVDKVTGKRYQRSSEFRNAFNPYPTKDYSRADEDFKYKNKETDKIRTYFNNKEVYMTYEEYKKHLEKLAETERVKGRIVHKIIQMLTTANMSMSGEIATMAAESDTHYEVNWRSIQTWLLQTWKDRLKELGVSVGKASGAVLGKDYIKSEVAVAIEELGVAGTIDMVVQHDDGTYTLVDFKSGKSLTRRSRFPKLMEFSKNNSQIEWNAMSQAKLQLMLYAVMMKSMNRNIKFRDIFVSHIDMNVITDNANPVEFKSYLAVLEEYFKINKPEWYALNKDLFNSNQYGGSLAEVDSDMEFSKANPIEQQRIYDTRLRKINLKLENQTLKAVERAGLEEEARDLAHKILQLENIGVRLDDHNKDMSMPRAWADNLYNVTDPMAQAFAKYTFDRKNNMRQYLTEARDEHNALLIPIINSYQGIGRKLGQKVGLNFNNYNDLFGFLYVEAPDGRKFVTEKGTMTDAQWEYSKYIRTTLKYEFYLTMSPKKLIEVIKEDLKTKDGIEKTLAERYLKMAENAPKIDKFNEFSAFKNKDFIWDDSFVPYVPTKDGENFNFKDMFSTKGVKEFFRKYVINKFTSEAIHKSFENYGMPVKYMSGAGFSSDQFTMNSSAIFENFMASIVGKRYLDDIYSLGRSTADYFMYAQNAEKTGYLTNTAEFIRNQTILHTTNEKKDVQWMSKGWLLPGGRKISIDSALRGLRSYVSAAVLAFKWPAGIVNAVLEIFQNNKEAVVGSIGKRLLTDKRFVDFTITDLKKANIYWAEMLADQARGKARDNKLYNLLRKFNYQTDNRMYPMNKQDILGAKNPILQQATLYAHFSIPEQFTNAMVLVAQMLHDKGANGKSMWDNYDNKANFIGVERGVSLKGEKIGGYTSEEILKLKSVSVRLHGGYREDERSALELYALGSAVMQFKRFMPNWIFEAWSSKREVSNIGHLIETGKNTVTNEKGEEIDVPILSWENAIDEGSARVFLKFFAQSIAHATKLNRLFVRDTAKGPVTTYRWHQLSPRQQANVISISVRLCATASMWLAVTAIFKDTPDDDEWKRRFGRMTFDLANGLNPMDLIRVGVNPTVIMPKLYMLSEGMYEFFFESALAGDVIDTGKHKGEYKGKSKISKMLPGYAQYNNLMGPSEE